MIIFAIVATFVVIFVIASAALAVRTWQDHMIRHGKRVDDRLPAPPRKYATLHVPEQWKPSESDLEDPNTRDTPPPSDPAS